MYQSLLSLLTIAVLPLSVFASPVQSHPAQLPLPSKTIFQLEKGSWIENIAVRSNNDLLLTLLSTPDLYTFTPSSSKSSLLYTFPNVTGLTGIAETTPDVFTVAGGNFSLATVSSTPGSYSVWRVDFRHGPSPAITKIADLPKASILNGMTTLPACPDKVLLSDNVLGLVWRLDTTTGEYEIAIQIPEMAPKPDQFTIEGVNGIKISGPYLYFVNSFNGLYRILIDSLGNVAPGAKAELLAPADPFMDDFAIDGEGNAWVATNIGDTVLFVGADGKSETVLGSNTTLTVAGDTSAAFGRNGEEKTLYVVTGGALGAPVNGTVTEGGKVVAVDTRGFSI
jgi:hypothetical protein